MELKKIEKKMKIVWYIYQIIIALLLALVFIPLVIYDGEAKIPLLITTAIIYVILAVILFIWPNLKYNAYSYGYDDKRIFINYGVIFKHRITVPVRQIQDLHIYKGPIMQMLNVSSLVISTAGSDHSIIGLDNMLAEEIVKEFETLLNNRLGSVSNEEI